MAQIGEIKVKISADTKGLDKGVRHTKKSLGQIDESAKESSRGMKGFSTSGVLAFAAVGTASVIAAGKILSVADNFAKLQTRIKTATKDTGDYNQVSKELFAISQNTGSSLESNVVLFQQLARSAKEVGATSSDVLDLTQALQQMGNIGGSSAEQMNNAMLQFGQSMAGGVVRAEEFNSIIENTPEIANRMAAGLGMTVGQLRLAVNEGNVLSSDVFNSLLKQTEDINAEFEKMPSTLERGGQSLSNSLVRAMGEFNQYLGEGLQSLDKNNNAIAEGSSLTGVLGAAMEFYADMIDKAVDSSSDLIKEHERLLELNKNISLTRGNIDLDLEAENNAQIADEMDRQLDAAIATQEWVDKRAKETRSFRKAQQEATEAAQEEALAQQEKNKLIEEELAWRQRVWDFEAAATRDRVSSEQEDNLAKLQEELEEKLEILQDGYKSEQELLQEDLDAKREIVLAAMEQGIGDKEENEKTLTNIEKEGADARRKIQDAEMKAKLAMTAGIFDNIMTLTRGKSKELFELAKTAATANAIVSTAQGVTNALASVPYPFNLAAAASVGLAGAVQIQTIQSQSFGSGGGNINSPTAGPSATAPTQASDGGLQQSAPQNVNISLQGDSYSRESVISLIDNINDAVADGARIKVQ